LFKWIDIRLSSLEVDCSDFNRQTTDVHSASATYVLKLQFLWTFRNKFNEIRLLRQILESKRQVGTENW